MESGGDFAVLYQAQATRSAVSWLKEHGKCIDHIRSGRSTLEHAGSGAFAKRFLPKGTLITGSPLHHMFRNLTDMYEFEDLGVDRVLDRRIKRGKRAGHQVLLNYCLGRPQESTLLLCPYGPGVNFINHNQTLANVQIRWAANGTTSHNSTWLTMVPSDMAWNYKISFGFDYVAIKDIEEGEELFMDYGDAWETAWWEHVQRWNKYNPQSPSEQWSSSYQSAAQFNAQLLRDNEPLLTQEEQVLAPYPSNLLVGCHSELEHQPERLDYYLDTFGINKWEEDWEEGPAFDWLQSSVALTCTIVNRWKSNVTSSDADKNSIVWYYDVELTLEVEENNTMKYDKVWRRGVPRRAISFDNAPYTTDLHLKHAFRHEIEIPKVLFPPAWKDLPS
jgi:SET domain